ncbi:MAG: Dabb family protein [Spirochaetes bacterium]|nr:Dabb family protein [Spirochaetota bacterium]
MFVHTVFFWAKPDASEGARRQLETDCRELLTGIPTVKKLIAGAPAMVDRPVVDNSYTVGLTVHFEDRAGHDVYQTHPIHLKFLERNKATWERVVVYDFGE